MILTACQPTLPAAPTRVAGVLVEPASDLEASCRELLARKDWLPCPTLLPNPQHVQVRSLADTREFFGVELVLGAPSEAYAPRQRPDGFPHFAIVDADSGLGRPAMGRRLQDEVIGGREGTLFLDETTEGFHKDHLVFIWQEGEHRISASLHTWDRLEEAKRMLAALVSGLR